jgi:flagellar protein FliS
MIANPYHQYQQVQSNTATGGQIIVLLYGGAIRFLTRGEMLRNEGDRNGFRADLRRAQDILVELAGGLDLNTGGEVAENLFRLYQYMIERIGYAEVKGDPDAIAEVVRLLRDIKGAWEEAITKVGDTARQPALAG